MSFNTFRSPIIIIGIILISCAIIIANTVFFSNQNFLFMSNISKNMIPFYIFISFTFGTMLIEIGFNGFDSFINSSTSKFKLNGSKDLIKEKFKVKNQFFRTSKGLRLLKAISYVIIFLGIITLICGIPKVIMSDIEINPVYAKKVIILVLFGIMLPLIGYGGLTYLQDPQKVTVKLDTLFIKMYLIFFGSLIYAMIIIFVFRNMSDLLLKLFFMHPIFPLYGYLSFLYGKIIFASGFSYSNYKNIIHSQKK